MADFQIGKKKKLGLQVKENYRKKPAGLKKCAILQEVCLSWVNFMDSGFCRRPEQHDGL